MEKRLYLNDGTYEKYVDLAVSYIMGPSRSIPAQIPTHNTIPQEGNSIETPRYPKKKLGQLVNTHNTHNGNLGKEYTHITTRKFTEIVPYTLKEEYKQKMFARIIDILGGTMLNTTCTWSKLNLDLCDSDGGKIIEKANASGNAKDSEIYGRRSYNRKIHTM